jgi:hypothetical protein
VCSAVIQLEIATMQSSPQGLYMVAKRPREICWLQRKNSGYQERHNETYLSSLALWLISCAAYFMLCFRCWKYPIHYSPCALVPSVNNFMPQILENMFQNKYGHFLTSRSRYGVQNMHLFGRKTSWTQCIENSKISIFN